MKVRSILEAAAGLLRIVGLATIRKGGPNRMATPRCPSRGSVGSQGIAVSNIEIANARLTSNTIPKSRSVSFGTQPNRRNAKKASHNPNTPAVVNRIDIN